MDTCEHTRYRQIGNLEIHEAEDGLIVFNAGTDKVHHLNPTAGVLFELCLQPRTLSELSESVQQLYQLAEAPSQECGQACAQLVEEGLLEEANAS